MEFETLAWGYRLVEGPRVDSSNNLYFSDVRGGGVYRRTPEGEITAVIPDRKHVGGIALHADGGLVISGARDIVHVRDGETRVLFKRDDVEGFNDLFTDAAGRVYVGSLQASPFNPPDPWPTGDLWRIDGPEDATVQYGGLRVTNGIGFSPDGRTLYHSDSGMGHILGSPVDAAGQVEAPQVFATVEIGFPDGLAVDEEGGVWVASFAGGCVLRYAPDGTLDRQVPVPAQRVTSLCFGGADGRDLYVVSADNTEAPERKGSIFRGRCEVAGLPAPPARV